ncbi:MAG TPA: hypothetical protein PKC67_00125 [Kiritimatiellia bacterium]|nr:hypothetical protein [Kiritimatiellia bacterium]HMP32726.1 hypothetical protein [Kiritimatiellia bacterium]
MNRSHAILLALVVTALTASAASDLTATLSTNRILVGDRVTLTITAILDEGESLLIPSLDRSPVITVWDQQQARRARPDGKSESSTTIQLTSFIVGEHRVATNPVLAAKAGGEETRLDLPPLLLHVSSVLSNPPPELADIKGPVSAGGPPWSTIAAVIAATTLLAAAMALLARKLLRRPTTQPSPRLLPPHDLALSALQALRARGWIETGNTGPFFVEVSAIVRLYLEQRFDLNAPEQTTEEFIRTSSQSDILSLAHRQLTQSFLEQSDLVKFARFAPAAADMEAALAAAERLVRETIPPPPTGGAQ